MSDKEWETFFELVDKIVGAGGTWQDKKTQVLAEAETNGSDGNWEELVGWFASDE